MFAMLLASAGVTAAQVLHVGDDPLADVVGAQRAGIRAVWLDRGAREWPLDYARPAGTVTTLTDLDALLAANEGDC
jgi:putative hydrolase of the HAD superfamily